MSGYKVVNSECLVIRLLTKIRQICKTDIIINNTKSFYDANKLFLDLILMTNRIEDVNEIRINTCMRILTTGNI